MKKHMFLMLLAFGWSADYLQALVTHQNIITEIGQKNGDKCETLVTAALLQQNRYCIFQGLLDVGTDLSVMLNFSTCVLFTNNLSVCTSSYSVFCDTCCSYNNTPGNKITARAIDLFLLLSILHQAYEITKLLLTAYPYAMVNIDNITNNWTPLMYASQLDNLPTAKLLINHGADITACSNTGLSVIELAEANSSQNMINLLIYTDRMKYHDKMNLMTNQGINFANIINLLVAQGMNYTGIMNLFTSQGLNYTGLINSLIRQSMNNTGQFVNYTGQPTSYAGLSINR